MASYSNNLSKSKSCRQEWQSLIVLNGTNIFLNGTNISFLKFMYGILNRGMANSFWNHIIQISSRQMYFQDIYSNLWKVKIFSGNIYSLKLNTYFCGAVCPRCIFIFESDQAQIYSAHLVKYKHQANPLLSMNNYTSLVISRNDKTKQLTLHIKPT